MKFKIALIGNPNSGKTTLFNLLTGSSAHIGNFPGVTVEKREAYFHFQGDDFLLIDLPGIYSLSPFSEEEVVSRNFIMYEELDLLINIVDASHLERSLYLSSQLLDSDHKLLIVANMMDEIKKRKENIDFNQMSRCLDCCCVGISANKKKGIQEMIRMAKEVILSEKTRKKAFIQDAVISSSLQKIESVLRLQGIRHAYFYANKYLENDPIVLQQLKEKNITLENLQINKLNSEDMEIKMASLRYQSLDNFYRQFFSKPKVATSNLTEKIDALICHRYLAYPIFFLLMYVVFQLSVGTFGSFFAHQLSEFFNQTLASFAKQILLAVKASVWAQSLICEGIIQGVGSILTFLPQIGFLFFALTCLEDSGYMARAAFIMDMPLQSISLSGHSFIPMLLGFGCSVPGIMASRTLNHIKDKRTTIILTPFMSCSARLPVYLILTSLFFPKHQGIVVLSLYLLGIFIAWIAGAYLKHSILKTDDSLFLLEMPPYRLPSLVSVFVNTWEKMKDFIIRAGTTIMAALIVIWFFQKFNWRLSFVEDSSLSMAGSLGRFITPVFKPLGFGSWQTSIALLSGFVAKEAIRGSLELLLGSKLVKHFTPASAYAFMVFVLLYTPCIAAVTATFKEMQSKKWAVFAIFFQTCTAWVVSYIIYHIAFIVI